MENLIRKALVMLFIAAIIWILVLFPYQWGHDAGYRDGQIDALTGAIYYKLEKQSNSEFRWVECPGICRYGKEGEK